MSRRTVVSTTQLSEALSLADEILIETDLSEVPTIRLRPGQTIRGATAGLAVHFAEGADGICCTTDNVIESLALYASPTARVIFNDTSCNSMGTIWLEDLVVSGAVQILARAALTSGHLEIFNLHIVDADTTSIPERPQGYGVSVVQGAFTLWNQQAADSRLTARIDQLSVGESERAIRGSGVFVSGNGENAGSVHVDLLKTGPVFSDGRIAPGTADQISGGVFVLHGVEADLVENAGPVVTYGSNDMALDNWGSVQKWVVHQPVQTHGSSAIGFVNFGILTELQVESPIVTSGAGARGFNVYAGTVQRAHFERIVTGGDGAVGIQISQPVGSIVVSRGVETFGTTGPSLVKGVIQQLPAVAVSIKPGGTVEELRIRGGLTTHGQGVPPLEQDGLVRSLVVEDGMANVPLPVAGVQ